MASHDAGRNYLAAAVEGVRQPWTHVADIAGDISKPQGSGSGNWPIQTACGAAINDEPKGQSPGPFLRGENGWGLNGNEHGSSIYEAWNFSSVVALMNKAPGYRKDQENRPDAERWIKAEIAKYCLGFKFQRPSRSVLFVENQGDYVPARDTTWGLEPFAVDGWSYPTSNLYGQRLYPVMPGSRQLERFNRHDSSKPQETTAHLDRNLMSAFISWALGYARKFPQGVKTRDGWGWPIWLAEKAIGKGFHEAAWQSFGLSRSDVSTFRRFLADRTDPRPLLAYLEGYTPTAGQECHWIQQEDGEIVSWINKTIHRSTTGCVLCWSGAERVSWASPQSTNRQSGAARCEREGDVFTVSATGPKLKNPPASRVFRPFTARELWEVVWNQDGFNLVDGMVGTEPVPRYPEHDGAISACGALLARLSPGTPDYNLVAAFGELINRQGGQRGQEALPASARPAAVVAAAEAILKQAKRLGLGSSTQA